MKSVDDTIYTERKGMTDSEFHDVFNRYYGQVKEFSFRILKNEAVAEDIAQDVFLKMYNNRFILPSVSNLRNYLFQMSRNAVIDYIRHETSMKLKNGVFFSERGTVDSFEDDFIAMETAKAAKEIVDAMPDKRRKIFILSRYYQKSNEEIAQMMQISRKTVENHIHLALSELKAKLPILVCLLIQIHESM